MKQEGEEDEAYSDFKHTDFAEYCEKGRLWWVPDFLPVRMQDFLYGRQSNLWESEIEELT